MRWWSVAEPFGCTSHDAATRLMQYKHAIPVVMVMLHVVMVMLHVVMVMLCCDGGLLWRWPIGGLTDVEEELDEVLLVELSHTVVDPAWWLCMHASYIHLCMHASYIHPFVFAYMHPTCIHTSSIHPFLFSPQAHTHQGQWWSMRLTHLRHTRQWWARGGRKVSHFMHTVHPLFCKGGGERLE